MFSKSNLVLLALTFIAASTEHALAREQWLERNGRAVYLYPRRFGQEQPEVLNKLRAACPGEVCGVLAGQGVTPLLAAQPECSQQDLADAIIDASKQFDAATQAAMVEIAIEYRQAEKNTPPDFTTNPPSLRNSVFCQKQPKNPELIGLVQAQDPANDPELFFDPALKATVLRGSQANTSPPGGAAANLPPAVPAEAEDPVEVPAAEDPAATACVTEVTVTVTGTPVAATDAVTVTAGNAQPTPAPTNPVVNQPPAGVDFGICSVPEIEFGEGFDGRRETSFQPADKNSFSQGSAQNINIITRAICDTLTNRCGANQAAKDLCATATQAAAAETVGSGAQADAFNAVFGIDTDFANDPIVNNQGVTISPGNAASTVNSVAPSSTAASQVPVAPTPTPAGIDAGGVGNFGRCSVPQIEFGAGFQGRRETSFQPTDLASFNHGSAQNIGIITQSICDTLTNSCAADQTAKDTCATAAAAAAAAAPAGSGAQADAFNRVFGITTNFSAVQQIDNQGRPVGVNNAVAPPAAAPAQPQPTRANNANNNNGGNNAGNNGGANLQTFAEALGGVTAPVVTAAGDRFQVAGNDALNTLAAAVRRSCDVQNNQCADAANASGNRNGLTVQACNDQQARCLAIAPRE